VRYTSARSPTVVGEGTGSCSGRMPGGTMARRAGMEARTVAVDAGVVTVGVSSAAVATGAVGGGVGNAD
jgi:hypothetical protein